MTRYAVAGIVACLYVVGATFVVQSAGKSYRSRLRESRQRASRNLASPPQALAAVQVASSASQRATTSSTPRSLESTTVAAKAKAEGATALAASSSKSARPEAPAVPSPAQAHTSPTEMSHPAIAWADSLDLAQLNVQDESRLGRELHRWITTYNRPVEGSPWEQRLHALAQPLLALRSRKDVEYTFTILDSEAVNAFSTPGGYVYLCRGIFNLIGEDEEYALEFVLGQEIAHVDLKHTLNCVAGANAEEKKRGLGTLSQFYLFIALGYPDKQVYEADAWVFQQMRTDLDRSRHDTLAFLRKFADYATTNKFSAGHQLPKPAIETRPGELPPALLDNHYRALTAAWKRLDALKALEASLKASASPLPK